MAKTTQYRDKASQESRENIGLTYQEEEIQDGTKTMRKIEEKT